MPGWWKRDEERPDVIREQSSMPNDAAWLGGSFGSGESISMENLLRVARALGALDMMVSALDPYATDWGRLRAQETLPERVRPPRTEQAP